MALRNRVLAVIAGVALLVSVAATPVAASGQASLDGFGDRGTCRDLALADHLLTLLGIPHDAFHSLFLFLCD